MRLSKRVVLAKGLMLSTSLADGAKAVDLGRRGGSRHADDRAYFCYGATRFQGSGLGRPQDSS